MAQETKTLTVKKDGGYRTATGGDSFRYIVSGSADAEELYREIKSKQGFTFEDEETGKLLFFSGVPLIGNKLIINVETGKIYNDDSRGRLPLTTTQERIAFTRYQTGKIADAMANIIAMDLMGGGASVTQQPREREEVVVEKDETPLGE